MGGRGRGRMGLGGGGTLGKVGWYRFKWACIASRLSACCIAPRASLTIRCHAVMAVLVSSCSWLWFLGCVCVWAAGGSPRGGAGSFGLLALGLCVLSHIHSRYHGSSLVGRCSSAVRGGLWAAGLCRVSEVWSVDADSSVALASEERELRGDWSAWVSLGIGGRGPGCILREVKRLGCGRLVVCGRVVRSDCCGSD